MEQTEPGYWGTLDPPTNGRAYRDQIRKQDRRKSDTLKEFLFSLQL